MILFIRIIFKSGFYAILARQGNYPSPISSTDLPFNCLLISFDIGLKLLIKQIPLWLQKFYAV